MTLRQQISPLLEEFQMNLGRGNHVNANAALLKMLNMIIDQVEKNTTSYPNWTTLTHVAPAAAVPTPSYQIFSAETGWPSVKPEEQMKEALEKLHAANYILDPDYTAIKDHLNLTDEERAAIKASVPDTTKIRKKPGRKPKVKDTSVVKVRGKPGPKPKVKVVVNDIP